MASVGSVTEILECEQSSVGLELQLLTADSQSDVSIVDVRFSLVRGSVAFAAGRAMVWHSHSATVQSVTLSLSKLFHTDGAAWRNAVIGEALYDS
jgi:hypothetical protein